MRFCGYFFSFFLLFFFLMVLVSVDLEDVCLSDSSNGLAFHGVGWDRDEDETLF